jgi:hypothetical protein
MADSYEEMDDSALERRLIELGFSGEGGRKVEAQKSAIRTVLALRRERREASRVADDVRRATELVNAVRPAKYRITEAEMNPHDAASIVTEPRWAALYATDAEIAAALEEFKSRQAALGWRGEKG